MSSVSSKNGTKTVPFGGSPRPFQPEPDPEYRDLLVEVQTFVRDVYLPDVIAIGEIMDTFSVEVAIQAALTGCKVITRTSAVSCTQPNFSKKLTGASRNLTAICVDLRGMRLPERR